MPAKHAKKHARLTPEMERRKWVKGQSGNPNGRKKGTGLKDLLLAELEKICPDDKKGRTWRELIVLATMRLAIRGNATALKELWERVDGKITLPIENLGDLTVVISGKYVPKTDAGKSE